MASQIFELLGQTGFQQIIASHGRGDEGEDDDDGWGYGFAGSVLRARRRQNATEKRKLPPVPNPEGRRLMDASVFGLSDDYRDTRRKTSKRLARKLLTRELGASRSNDLRTTSALTQVSGTEMDMRTFRLTKIAGPHSFYERRQNHPLQRQMLLRPIFG